MGTIEWIVSLLGAGVGLVLSFRFFFSDLGELLEALKFWITPDIFSVFRGEWATDQWNELKLILWILIGVAFGCSAYGVYHKLGEWFAGA